ncbi:MAG: PfkB family carbohydrate kinase [candidate division WOR-3 bacterium]|nr:PfkB family carbohydrate kinase [candidate division WOR-3 bacterium]
MDTAWDARGRWMKLLEPCLPYLDIFLPAVEEARMITDAETVEEIAKILIDKGVKIVGLKMGKEGCYIRTKSKKIRIPAYPVEVIDTTGAGDAFVAGFLTGILKKWSLEKTGRLANAAGALSTTAIGATGGLISLKKTLEFMNKFFLTF